MHILDIHIHSSSYIFCSISGEDRKAQLRIKFCKQRDDSSFPRIFVVQVLEPLRSVSVRANVISYSASIRPCEKGQQ